MYVNAKNKIKNFHVVLSTDDKEIEFNVKPPRISILAEVKNVEKSENEFEDIQRILLKILNKNEEKIEISSEFFDESVDAISLMTLWIDIVEWITKTINDPN